MGMILMKRTREILAFLVLISGWTTPVTSRSIHSDIKDEEAFSETDYRYRRLGGEDYCLDLPIDPPDICFQNGGPSPECVPFRSPDYCPEEKSFPALIQHRTGTIRNDPDYVESNNYWFQYLDSDKLAGYTLAVTEGYRTPRVYYCTSDIENGLDDFSPHSKAFVVRASGLHSDAGVFVLPNGFGGIELIRGSSMTLVQIKESIRKAGATKVLIEEFIAGPNGDDLPMEFKVHAFNGQIGSINIVYNKGTSCACWAEVDENFERLDQFGCFSPGGTEVSKQEECYEIDFSFGRRKAREVKGYPICNRVVKPDDCVLKDIINIASEMSKKIGVYVRLDMFVSGTGEVFLQEFSFDHLHGTRHCSARQDSLTGCIDSCFLGEMWADSSPSDSDVMAKLFGGPATPKPEGLIDYLEAPANTCDFIMNLKKKDPFDHYKSACPTKITQTDVVVIGAGAAGVSAALRLAEVDPNLDVTILESTNRIGGRVKSKFNFGVEDNKHTIEDGANWIYANGNEIYALALLYNISSTPQNESSLQLHEYLPCNGSERRKRRLLEEDRLDHYIRELNKLDIEENRKKLMRRHLRRLAGHGLEECSAAEVASEDVTAGFDIFYDGPYNCTGNVSNNLWCEEIGEDIGYQAQYIECGFNASDPVQFLWKVIFGSDSENSGMANVSMYEWFDVFSFNAVSEFVTDQDVGFEGLIQGPAKEAGLEPLFEHRVLKIKYDHFNEDYRALVYVVTEWGEHKIFEAKRVISTVPSEVLNLGLIEFEPQLRYSADLFNPLKGRNSLKIFYQFDTVFWDQSFETLYFLNAKEPSPTDSFIFFNLDHPGSMPGSKILMLLLFDEHFEAVVGEDNLWNEKIADEVLISMLEPLRLAHPDEFRLPIQMHHNTWHADMNAGFAAWEVWNVGYDPWSYYSFYGGGADNYYLNSTDICNYNGCNGEPGENETERILYMAGTASCLEFYGLVYGGWYSGEIAANYLLESLMDYTEEEIGGWYDVCYWGFNETLSNATGAVYRFE